MTRRDFRTVTFHLLQAFSRSLQNERPKRRAMKNEKAEEKGEKERWRGKGRKKKPQEEYKLVDHEETSDKK